MESRTTYSFLVRSQTALGNSDADTHFFTAPKDIKSDNVAYTHVEHHIDDMILTGDLGGVTVYGCADENILGLKDSVCERVA